MIPYQGSKRKIAQELLSYIPSADHFYDLFGGGGAITKAAVESGRWQTCHYNEINTGVYELFKSLCNGTFDFEKARSTWISRERFFSEKDLPTAWGGYVATCWSFGNGLDTYLYGKDKELAKLFMFALVTYDNPYFPNTTQNERRLLLQRAIRSLANSGVQVDKAQYALESLYGIQNLTRLQSLENLTGSVPVLASVTTTNCDYKQVEIAPKSVVYCDIPYHGGGADPKSYNITFNHNEFLNWAATSDVPTYVSEYEITDPRFQCLWEKDVRSTFSAQSNTTSRTERLYWNGVSAG